MSSKLSKTMNTYHHQMDEPGRLSYVEDDTKSIRYSKEELMKIGMELNTPKCSSRLKIQKQILAVHHKIKDTACSICNFKTCKQCNMCTYKTKCHVQLKHHFTTVHDN